MKYKENRMDMNFEKNASVKFEDYTKKVLANGLESHYNGGGHSNQCRQVSDQQP